MIAKGSSDVVNVVAQGIGCIEVYSGRNLVWQSVSSCFGSGAWFNMRPWINNENWKNN